LSSLKNKKSTTALRSALSCLCVGSDAYDNAYEETVARITALGPDSENLAKQALLILSCARQPLLTEDLAYALSVEPDSETIDEDNVPDIEDVVAVCAGLVVIDKESNVVQLVHKSTQEYFERNRARWFPRANDIMARLCIQYRSMALSRMSSGTRKATKVLPFWRYADANVFHHTLVAEREVEAAGEMTTVSSNAIVLSNVSSTSELALRQLAKDMGGSLQSTLISACRDGRHALVELLLTVNNYEWSQSPNHSGSKVFLSSLRKQLDASQDDVLLTIAARRRDYAMLKILLDQGADPNVVNPFGQTALYIAASNGSESLIALLLEHPSIDLNCECVERHLLPRSFRDEYADKSWAEGILWTPLLVAARAGHLGSVKMLLNRADRRYRDRGGMNVACLAAAIGHCEIIKELLEWSDIEMDPRSNQQHRSALEMAIKRVQHEACQILIPISDVNREYANGNGPLHEAILQRSSKLVQELLSKEGVVINAYGNSPVQLAAEQSFEILFALVRHIGAHGIHDKHWESAQSLLMDKCRSRAHINSLSSILMFDINVRDKFGSAFLHRICVINRISILEAILQKPSIDVNICDRDGNTPLMKAVQHGKCEAIDALLSHSGVLVDTENQAGNTALLIASALISDPDNRFHRTPDAAQHILEKFLRHPDVRKNHQNKAGQTVLTLAVQHGTRPMLQSIIEVTDLAGQFHQIFQNGRTLISYCSEFNTPDTFDFILEESLPHFIDLADNEGRTPLSYAAEAGNYRTMRRLMGIANVRIGLADIKGYTPLDYAIQSGSKEAEIWLLMKGAKKASNKRKATEPLPIRNAKRLEESLE
jgi:ankyrin repeat protein